MSSFSRRRRIVANDGRMLGSSAQQSLTSLLQAIGQRGICGRSFWVPTAKTTCIAHPSNAAVMPREGRGFRLKVVSVDVPGMEASPCMGPPSSPAPTTRCRSCRCPLFPCTAHFVALRAPSNRASVCFRMHKSNQIEVRPHTTCARLSAKWGYPACGHRGRECLLYDSRQAKIAHLDLPILVDLVRMYRQHRGSLRLKQTGVGDPGVPGGCGSSDHDE